eukprot:CAMPEP_0185829960 /NCGR_PEP_ID=MMETSP1353-20130828/547_1 /TAXON_ID=1077150 /ORGANISM="Erythrolobus australicus, Strain CCMP3124" /LENGTH=171 /DNA_ID=CAMNT_0028527807 /DNA_START=93 /DNA_END=605 /DNA_ORIENTATION=+
MSKGGRFAVDTEEGDGADGAQPGASSAGARQPPPSRPRRLGSAGSSSASGPVSRSVSEDNAGVQHATGFTRVEEAQGSAEVKSPGRAARNRTGFVAMGKMSSEDRVGRMERISIRSPSSDRDRSRSASPGARRRGTRQPRNEMPESPAAALPPTSPKPASALPSSSKNNAW